MRIQNDTKYALDRLVRAVDKWAEAKNVHPATEKSFKELEEADIELLFAMSTAKAVLEDLT